MKLLFLILFLISFSKSTLTQTVVYQDICHCGVTGAGFSTGMGFGSGSFTIHIEPGSTIIKAYAFAYKIGFPPLTTYVLNGNSIVFDTTNSLTTVSYTSSYASPISLYYQDVTALINPPIVNYNITIPTQSGLPINWGYWSFFLYVIYENPSLSICNTSIILNNQNLTGNETYNLNNLNPINTNFPVGFSIYSDRSMDGLPPDEKVIFNGNLLGIIGGSDAVNSAWNYAGVKGHFYYQNKTLFGLDDDTPDAFMDSTDGLADVSSYLINNVTSCNFQLLKTDYPNQPVNETHVNLAYFLTYTTPCDTFSVSVSNDTTICAGETVQLHASGGNTSLSKPAYEWRPHKNLSCYNCANPIFSGDSSQVYTVRIWNTDSCSKVLPVRVKVLPAPTFSKITTTQSECGNATGAITAISEGSADSLFLDSNFVGLAPQTLQNIGGDNYTLFLKDTNGCKSADTVVIVPSTITTIANLTAQPTHGSAPLQVSLTNTSQNATDYSWWLGGTYQGNNFSGFLADTSGTYHIQLIAWNNDSLCADTANLTVLVYDSLVTRIPNVFTPNGDGVNDYFTVTVNLPVQTTLVILNRWGNVVHAWEGMLQKGKNVLWNGNSAGGLGKGSAKVSDGTYFYKFVFSDLPGKEKTRKATGYVEVLR